MATTTLRPTPGPSVPTSSRTEAVRSDAGARLPIPPTHTHCADRPNEMRGAVRLSSHADHLARLKRRQKQADMPAEKSQIRTKRTKACLLYTSPSPRD